MGLLRLALKHILDNGYDLVVGSGTVRQLKLYRHFGSVPFGPLVGTRDAMYQPMYLFVDTFIKKFPWISRYMEEMNMKGNRNGKDY